MSMLSVLKGAKLRGSQRQRMLLENRSEGESSVRPCPRHKGLEEAQARLAAIVESSNDAIIGKSLDGKITSWNLGAEKIFGYTSTEAIGQPGSILLPEGRAGEERDILTQISLGQRVNRIESERVRKDGTRIQVSLTISPIKDSSGKVIGASKIARDITERKQQEEELRQAKEAAEAANRAKSAFLANMSHEIRTPMNAILGFSQLMGREANLTPLQKQYLETINRNGEHLLALINDILEMSKIEAGKSRLNLEASDFHVLLEDLEAMFRPRAESKQLRFNVERSATLPRVLEMDENKVRQIFINLLGNAVKFTTQGFVALRVESQPTTESDWYRIVSEVQDTGPGISESEARETLFGPFAQAEAGQRSRGGTGLGLAISREFARLMGGDITVTSQYGKGSIFRVELLLKASPDKLLRESKDEGSLPRFQLGNLRPRLLVVDDLKDNRMLISRMVDGAGLEFREAINGREAIQIYETWKPNLIIMDMRMPVLDGYDAIRHIRASAEGKKVKILGITASAFDENRARVMATGADDFLAKPFRVEDLFHKIGTLLNLELVSGNASAGSAV